MPGYIKYVKDEKGNFQRVAADQQEMISLKEAEVIKMYNELEALKNNAQ